MNILPLIFTFLIILSCVAFTFLREVKSIFLAETSFEGFNRTERVVNNAIAKKAYRKVNGKAIAKKSNHQKGKKGVYVSKRSAFPPLDCSKFNLAPLIQYQGELKLHPLHEPLAEFLRLLYRKSVFNQVPNAEKIEYRLLEALVKKAQKSPEAKTMAELYPDDPILAKIFYTMLKGTNQYERDRGIPPLGDFLFLDKEKTAVSFSFASPPLLEALFGKEVTDFILQEEQRKWSESNKYHFFSKEDLQTILMKNPVRASSFSALESHLNFSKKSVRRLHIGGRDKRTGIGIEKQL